MAVPVDWPSTGFICWTSRRGVAVLIVICGLVLSDLVGVGDVFHLKTPTVPCFVLFPGAVQYMMLCA